jgi:hypothetical protein
MIAVVVPEGSTTNQLVQGAFGRSRMEVLTPNQLCERNNYVIYYVISHNKMIACLCEFRLGLLFFHTMSPRNPLSNVLVNPANRPPVDADSENEPEFPLPKSKRVTFDENGTNFPPYELTLEPCGLRRSTSRDQV